MSRKLHVRGLQARRVCRVCRVCFTSNSMEMYKKQSFLHIYRGMGRKHTRHTRHTRQSMNVRFIA
jgi:hypothetical protein